MHNGSAISKSDRTNTPGSGYYDTHDTADGFKSKHKGGSHFVMCDGAVRFLADTINYDLYQRLGDRKDAKPIGNY